MSFWCFLDQYEYKNKCECGSIALKQKKSSEQREDWKRVKVQAINNNKLAKISEIEYNRHRNDVHLLYHPFPVRLCFQASDLCEQSFESEDIRQQS